MNDVSSSDFHALLHIMVAETAGTPLTLAQLRQRMDVSPPAITYLVDRMIEAGHIRREPDPEDRRKWLLRYENRGMTLAHTFFRPLGTHISAALADLTDKDLAAAHRVFTAMITGMSVFEDELHAPRPEAASPAWGELQPHADGRGRLGPSHPAVNSKRCSISSAPRATPPVAAKPAATRRAPGAIVSRLADGGA